MSKASDFNTFLKKIKNKKAKIGVVGLGYVGFPLAMLLADTGFAVTGFVRNEKKIKVLKKKSKNKLTIEIFGKLGLEKQDVIIICVPTPVTEDKIPDLSDLQAVASQLSQINISGKLIINESTVAPFTTSEVLGDLGKNYFLVSSPERIDPGNETKTTQSIPKVIGGRDKQGLTLAKNLYRQILTGEIVEVGSLEAAEMAKMLENTYRAVNIALINEFAKLAERCKIDILEVIKAAKTKWSFQAHYPGIGVGGHCIPVDPYYILELAKNKKVSMDVVKDSLLENEKMPMFLVDKLKKYYKKGGKVLVYGLTYKKDVGDLRESPAIIFCNLLKESNIPFKVYEPFSSEEEIRKLGFEPGKLEKIDFLIIAADHSSLVKDSLKLIGKNTIIIDGKNYFSSKKGKGVMGVGRELL